LIESLSVLRGDGSESFLIVHEGPDELAMSNSEEEQHDTRDVESFVAVVMLFVVRFS